VTAPLVAPQPGGRRLRAWQAEALQAYREAAATDFLVTATPGAGKTSFALALAAELLERREVNRVVVVAPTDHLRTQWAEAAQAAGILLDPTVKNDDRLRPDVTGYVTTYAQVAMRPAVHRSRTEHGRRTLVVLDEIHHAGDGLSWGEAVAEAFEPARRGWR
jgi:superfamily II DNA or RNA helicase